VDATIVRAHQHAAGPPKGPGRHVGSAAEADQALGRSRGGLTTKLHLVTDGRGRPLGMLVTAGQRHESTQLGPLLDTIRVPRPTSGRPRKRPDHLTADRGYSYPGCRRLLRRRRIAHTIPERSDQQATCAQRGARGGRPRKVDRCATGSATWSSGTACQRQGSRETTVACHWMPVTGGTAACEPTRQGKHVKTTFS
jgi:transposase